MLEENQNTPLTAIIIDDELSAINVLTKLLERIGGVKILAAEQSPNLGLRHIMVMKPDVVFLDIQMDKKNGISLLKEIKELSSKSHIVITSGYDDYTFEAFKNGAFDYLIKPVGIEDLEKTIFRIQNKGMTTEEETREVTTKDHNEDKPTVKIRTTNDAGYLLARNILYLKASGSYTEIYTLDGRKEICTRGLWLMERELPDYFFRIHRSVVVNTLFVNDIKSETQTCVVADDNCSYDLTISKANIEALEDYLKKNR